jgi:hypothetical protein
MANLVTKFRYYKPKKSKTRGNYVKYVATRDGVEKIPRNDLNKPASKNQTDLIKRILRDFPDSVEMHEYADYVNSPTVETASEFITRAIEDNINIFIAQPTYADYIATRPRVEKTGTHGLFSSIDEEVNLKKVSEEISQHEGNVWTMIVSLRREDAERLGYNNAKAWRDLIRTKSEEISRNFKIPLNELKWYGAFHNEGHHPHVHIIIYSNKADEGYLSHIGIDKMRSSLANTIFEDDMYHIAEEQTKIRNELKTDWKKLLQDIFARIEIGTYENEEIKNKLIELSIRLNNTKSKKVYGYLKKDIKELIDSIVDLLAEDEEISKLYDLWYEEKYKILRMYSNQMPPKIPLSENKEFKSIKNDIIREALRILLTEEGDIKMLPPKGKKRDQEYYSQKKNYYESKKHVSANSVTRLFKNLANIFSDKMGGDDNKKLPTIDKRQRREIEDKKNAELTLT